MPESPTEFLARMIDRDEAVARAATPGPWSASLLTDAATVDVVVEQAEAVYPDAHQVADVSRCEHHKDNRSADARFIAAWDPARVLAECAGKREIVEVLLPGSTNPRDYQGFPGIVVRALLRPYAGEPGFNPTWLED